VKKGYSFITQRDNGFVVFYTINIFKKDSLRELADVSDNIQARMLALKKHTLKEEIKDSLYTIYGYD
jgi:cold shock CspA family protein